MRQSLSTMARSMTLPSPTVKPGRPRRSLSARSASVSKRSAPMITESRITTPRPVRLVAQQAQQRLPLEQVNAHAGEVLPALGRDAARLDPLRRRPHGVELGLRLGLLDEADDPAGVVQPHDAEAGGLLGGAGDH